MAIADFFLVGPPATADEVEAVMDRVAVEQELAADDHVRFDKRGAFLSSGVQVSTSASVPPPFLDAVKEVFGFDPTVSVLFSFYGGDDPIRQRQDIIRLVTAVLTEVSGDAFFAFEREITRLVRLSGRLTISEHDDYWRPEVVALLPPHDRAALPDV